MSSECDKCGNYTSDCVCKLVKNKRLNLQDRQKIEELLHSKVKHNEICEQVGIQPSTFYREMKKCQEAYNAEEANDVTGRTRNLIDWEIIGKSFGMLIVLEYVNIYKGRSWWRCRCECGKECIMSRKMLMEYCSPRRPLSCGCIAKQWKDANNKLPPEELALRKYQDLMNFRKINQDCWEWTGYKQKGKTPKTSWKNQGMSVRKCMYMLINGLEYEPKPVFTICGNLLCFNPDHLTLERPKIRQYYK